MTMQEKMYVEATRTKPEKVGDISEKVRMLQNAVERIGNSADRLIEAIAPILNKSMAPSQEVSESPTAACGLSENIVFIYNISEKIDATLRDALKCVEL